MIKVYFEWNVIYIEYHPKMFSQFLNVLMTATILLLIFYLHIFILHRSSISLEVKCFPKKEIEDYPLAGSFNAGTGEISIYRNVSLNQSNQTIIKQINNIEEIELTPEELRTLRHEKTHQRQFREGRLATCDDPIKVYLNEVEAYLSEYVP